MKDILIIVGRNLFSPIVIAILILSSILLILNEPRDAWFLSVVIIVNTLFAIIQEIRAKLALKKLELMNMPFAHKILDNGKIQNVHFEKLVTGDKIKLELGDEVPADGLILKSEGLESDESILTGESIPIEKNTGTTIYAASAIVAGSAVMEVTLTGADTKIGKMATVLKRYKPTLTPIQQTISHAITRLTFGALILAVLIYIIYSLSNQDAILIFKTIASAAVVVVPEGLLLASTLLLAYGSLKLAKAKVLPQKLSAIEAMSLLDVLCVDKTGTLTSDKITFEKYIPFIDNQDNANEIIGIVAKETSSGSATGDAISGYFNNFGKYKVLQTLAFSSGRKMSGLRFTYNKKTFSVLIGAPEFVGKVCDLSSLNKKTINQLTSEGKRVLLVAVMNNPQLTLKKLDSNSGSALGVIVLSNELRLGVKDTVMFLQDNGVKIRVISGDNPNTVSYVSAAAGIKNHGKFITGSELTLLDKKKWDKVIANTTIFARVLPEQKERIIKTLKRLGYFTGMVGDGINDALAIKKSDLGVAMYSGSVATRRVADIVLLDNSFNSLPLGMKLGNKILQAIEIIATLFFHKIIFGVVLLLATLILGLVYPFEPRHITFMNIFLVTMPTIMWTFFTPSPRHRLSPKYFWKDTLIAVAPIAVLSGVMVTLTYALLTKLHPSNFSGVSTATVIIATFFGIYLVFLVPLMFDVRNNKKAKIARYIYSVAVLSVVIPSFSLEFARDFFDFTMPTWQNAWPFLFVIFGTAFLQWIIAQKTGERLKNRNLD